ncbi:YdeI/OmpD-associated family protein [Pedobacter ghigonis]|uniref:YdeI/OmpD-associated family protein n=1 Tax=Pedobacter ghigonis TaxID=2730403 RepID=UPI0015895AAD|nr:YdeI/OmpD-associated family protein [Pedobacter ghigonis]
MAEKTTETFCPTGRAAWREWLLKNHDTKQSVWLVCYKTKANKPTLSWSDAVEEALCFGWIDSIRKTIDEESFTQFFSRRKPNSGWSKINKAKVEQLAAAGLMTQAGLECINRAKENGSWTILDEVEELVIPADLATALEDTAGSKTFFMGLSKSVRKAMLQWITFAKRPETRQKRIAELVELASQNKKPKQF